MNRNNSFGCRKFGQLNSHRTKESYRKNKNEED